MINLVEKKSKNFEGLENAKKVLNKASTLILLIWVIIMTGFLGYTWYLNQKKSNVNNELVQLESELAQYSEQEIIVRKLYSRAAGAQEFLSQRDQVGKKLEKIIAASGTPVSWIYEGDAKQTLTSTVKTPSEFNQVVEVLKPDYTKVIVQEVVYKVGIGWTGSVSLAGFSSKI